MLYLRFALLFALSPIVLCATGCQRQAGGKGSISFPPEGAVRVVATKIENGPARVHYKWSLIGERNWAKAEAKGSDLSLSQVYSLNDVDKRGGCNVWEADVTLEKDGVGTKWTTQLHGSVGTTVTNSGTVANAPFPAAAQIVQTQDTVPDLPATLELARIGDTTIHLRVDK